MEDVGYAEPAAGRGGPSREAAPRVDPPAWHDEDFTVDLRTTASDRRAVSDLPDASDAPYDAPYDAGYDTITPLMQRALGEQLAEQRMLREALVAFDRRIEILERSVADGVAGFEREVSERVEHFERSVTERMAAFEQVLKRVVDRLAGTEERVLAGIDHNDKVLRAHLDTLRPSFEGAVDRVVEWVEQLDAANVARQTALRDAFEGAIDRFDERVDRLDRAHVAREAALHESFEGAIDRFDETMAASQRLIEERMAALASVVDSAVLASMAPALGQAVDEVRASLDGTERRVRRAVQRVTQAVAAEGDPFPGFSPVADRAPVMAEVVALPEAGAPPEARAPVDRSTRRARPLRARRVVAPDS